MSVDKPSMTKRPIRKKEPYMTDNKEPNELVHLYLYCQRHHERNTITSPPRGGRGNKKTLSFHHTLVPTGPPVGDEDHPTQSYRPAPRDVNVPLGYERKGGLIVPQQPQPFGVRYEGQHPDDTMDEHLVRRKVEFWNFMMMLTAIILIVFNVTVAITSMTGFEFPFPIGFIPLPFFVWVLHIRQKRSNQLSKMKRTRENKEIEALLEDSRSPRSLGTTTITR